MKPTHSRIAFALCLPLAAVACSAAHARTPASPAPTAASAAPAKLPAPVQTERFVLKPGQTVIGRVQIVRIKPHQVLSDIARLFDVGYDAIKHANPKINPWLAPVGTPVIVPTQFILPDAPHVGIVVNVAAMRLFYFPPHKPGQPQVVITHPVGIGRLGWPTPTGLTEVVGHIAHPAWVVPRSILAEHAREGVPLPHVVPAGPTNPLGNWAMPLGWPGYLIHGTDKPAGVGRRVSHGCIHLYPEDIKQLFQQVPNGTPVRVVNQPFLFGWKDGRLYMQAYGPLQDDKRPWKTNATLLDHMLTRRLIHHLAHADERVDWSRVRALVADPKVVPLPVSGHGLVGEGLVATLVQNRLPRGSAWNGKTHLPLTTAQFRKIMARYDASLKHKRGAIVRTKQHARHDHGALGSRDTRAARVSASRLSGALHTKRRVAPAR
ncbi:MAG: L,D-transpeptidase family protein [Steroidobacteraceae bacterium]